MEHSYISRTLWYVETQNGQTKKIELKQTELLTKTQPLIVLGEAGMGKTQLLQQLGKQPGYCYCTAKQLIARSRPQALLSADAHTLVIDALDEAPAHQQHDAVTDVLKKLDELGYPRFILSCRVAEWQSSTATTTIQEGDYPQVPLQLHLDPFSATDIQNFLSARLGSERAAQVLEHFENLGLIDWLGNPQTLDLISAIGLEQELPQTRAQLLNKAVEKLAVEHNPQKTSQQQPPATLITAAGAACAALILCAQTSIVRKPSAHLVDGEILLQTLQQLPGGTHIAQALNTRLFVAHSPDQFGYLHRRIGEYLAARWLAQQANTDRKRRRLLGMFQHHGMVPASLRGLYAWLAHSPQLAESVIAFDPMAVIEYGETGDLPAHQARLLHQALAHLPEDNTGQRQLRSLKIRCFAQENLQADVAQWITPQNQAMTWLRVLVIESLEATAMAEILHFQLKQTITNAKDCYIARNAAFHSLASRLSVQESGELLDQLAALADEDSLRLSLEIAHTQGFDNFRACALAQISLAYVMTSSQMIGKFFYLQQDLPDSHLLAFLDTFTEGIARMKKNQDYERLYEINSLAFALMVKAVNAQLPDASQVLQWFSALDSYYSSTEDQKQLNTAICNAPQLRQSIQRTLLIAQSTNETLRSNCVELSHYASALQLSEVDLIGLLDALPANDGRWKELVLLAHHDAEHGSATRQAAQRFAEGSLSDQEWIEQLAAPRPKYDWQIKQEERDAKRKAEKTATQTRQIAQHTKQVDALKAGDWEACWWAAAVYLGRHNGHDKAIPPEERLQHVLTEELAHAAHSGFEAHLLQSPTSPSLDEISQGYAQNTEYRVSHIVIAGMLERLRHGRGVADLSDDRILAGFLFLQPGFHEHFGTNTKFLQACIHQELLARGLLEKALRLFYEPQLKANLEHVSSLHQLLHDEAYSEISTLLAQEWLQHFPNLRPAIETQLIDSLVHAQATDVLKTIAQQRTNPHPVIERHLTWEAIRLLIDFEPTARRLRRHAIDANLLWQLQERSQRGRYGNSRKPLTWTSAQCAWVFENFRALWPATWHPVGTSGGSHNPWDATEFLHSIAQQLANTTTSEAIAALHALRDAPADGYTVFLQSLGTQQQRKQCEQAYAPQPLSSFLNIANDAAPQSIQDLQEWVLEELRIAQTKIRANDVDSWRGFYTDNYIPYTEERCRDHLLELLRQGSKEVVYAPETHVAADKEVDITCCVGALRLPIEIKGQWHKDVWTAADNQLDHLYTADWQAASHGIYLVLWFGEQKGGKALKTLGKGHPTPMTADEMQKMLTSRSLAAQSGKVAVVVFDIARASDTGLNKTTTKP